MKVYSLLLRNIFISSAAFCITNCIFDIGIKNMTWNQFDENQLITLEKQILSVVNSTYKTWYVPINFNHSISTTKKECKLTTCSRKVGDETQSQTKEKIWTLSLNEDSKNTPLVLWHGFAAAVGFWCPNLDELSKDRPVYALDLIGFGRSSRPKFSSDPLEAEQQFVDALEEWRKEVGLEKFVLLGHSFGGYLATAYTIKYPDRVEHLILADPWGFETEDEARSRPTWVTVVTYFFYPFTQFNPLASIRAVGPLGPWVLHRFRGDIAAKYSDIIENTEIISKYMYHCNAQNPTGETAFQNMMKPVALARHPMLHRVHTLREDIPMSLIHGTKTWMDITIGEKIKKIRGEKVVQVELIENSSHHLHADGAEKFNNIVRNICGKCDNK